MKRVPAIAFRCAVVALAVYSASLQAISRHTSIGIVDRYQIGINNVVSSPNGYCLMAVGRGAFRQSHTCLAPDNRTVEDMQETARVEAAYAGFVQKFQACPTGFSEKECGINVPRITPEGKTAPNPNPAPYLQINIGFPLEGLKREELARLRTDLARNGIASDKETGSSAGALFYHYYPDLFLRDSHVTGFRLGHPDHVRWFSPAVICDMLEYTAREIEHELAKAPPFFITYRGFAMNESGIYLRGYPSSAWFTNTIRKRLFETLKQLFSGLNGIPQNQLFHSSFARALRPLRDEGGKGFKKALMNLYETYKDTVFGVIPVNLDTLRIFKRERSWYASDVQAQDVMSLREYLACLDDPEKSLCYLEEMIPRQLPPERSNPYWWFPAEASLMYRLGSTEGLSSDQKRRLEAVLGRFASLGKRIGRLPDYQSEEDLVRSLMSEGVTVVYASSEPQKRYLEGIAAKHGLVLEIQEMSPAEYALIQSA